MIAACDKQSALCGCFKKCCWVEFVFFWYRKRLTKINNNFYIFDKFHIAYRTLLHTFFTCYFCKTNTCTMSLSLKNVESVCSLNFQCTFYKKQQQNNAFDYAYNVIFITKIRNTDANWYILFIKEISSRSTKNDRIKKTAISLLW